MVFSKSSSSSVNPQVAMTSIKNAQSEKAIVDALASLGLSDSLVSALRKYPLSESASVSVFEKKNLVRTDVFRKNINEDTTSEYISQAIFKVGSDEDNTATRYYFVFINADSTKKFQPLWNHIFENTLCNLMTSGKTTFGFSAVPNAGYSMNVFQRNIVESCGMELATHDQADTLAFKNSRYIFSEGKPVNAFYENRMDITQ